MRRVQNIQPQLGELAIADIDIDLKSRDETAQLLRGLQCIYVNNNSGVNNPTLSLIV